MLLRPIWKLLLILIISQASLAANDIDSKNVVAPIVTTNPEVHTARGITTLKGSKEPYTGIVEITNSYLDDVVVKKSFIEGIEDTTVFVNKSTNEKLDGRLEAFHPNGAISMLGNLNKGLLDGVVTTWYSNGNIKTKTEYSQGVRYGPYETYYVNGNKKQIGTKFRDGSIEWTDWNINGHKESFIHFKQTNQPPIVFKQWDSKGRKNGLWSENYPDGSNKKVKHYTHGYPSGTWATWYDNEQKQTEVEFSRGLLSGPVRFWNEKGVLVVDGQFKDSKEVGIWSFKDNDGNPIQRPKNFRVNITDEDDTILDTESTNNSEAYYVSIYMPLAIALLVLLPLFGMGMCWAYRRLKSKNG